MRVLWGAPGTLTGSVGRGASKTESRDIGFLLQRTGLGQLLVKLGDFTLGLRKLQLQTHDLLAVVTGIFKSGACGASGRSGAWESVGSGSDGERVAGGGMIQASLIRTAILAGFEGFILLAQDSLLLRELSEKLVHWVRLLDGRGIVAYLHLLSWSAIGGYHDK
jgi:hypothetical protein